MRQELEIPTAHQFSAPIARALTRMAALGMLAVVRLERRISALPSNANAHTLKTQNRHAAGITR